MGSKASDALQSNAVIWVEGPSDRILLKKWLELCDADVSEGNDFSIMFYGGDLLAHLTMDETHEAEEYIRLLRINRNSAIIIDSDKRRQNEPLRQAKQRVKDEAERENRLVWITKGKEIENYISGAILAKHLDSPPDISQYEPPWPKLVGRHPKGATRGLHSKVEFAEFVSQHATADEFQFDWQERTLKVIEYIRRANLRA
jgi:hypothetical protein